MTSRTGIGRHDGASVSNAVGPGKQKEAAEDLEENVETEWWRTENTALKEFARNFRILKVFGEDLGAPKQAPIDVLSWEL